jgi:hypothetical protein
MTPDQEHRLDEALQSLRARNIHVSSLTRELIALSVDAIVREPPHGLRDEESLKAIQHQFLGQVERHLNEIAENGTVNYFHALARSPHIIAEYCPDWLGPIAMPRGPNQLA